MEIGLEREQGDEIRAEVRALRCAAGDLVDPGAVRRRHVVVLADRPRQRPSDRIGGRRDRPRRPGRSRGRRRAACTHSRDEDRSRAEPFQQHIGEPAPGGRRVAVVGPLQHVRPHGRQQRVPGAAGGDLADDERPVDERPDQFRHLRHRAASRRRRRPRRATGRTRRRARPAVSGPGARRDSGDRDSSRADDRDSAGGRARWDRGSRRRRHRAAHPFRHLGRCQEVRPCGGEFDRQRQAVDRPAQRDDVAQVDVVTEAAALDEQPHGIGLDVVGAERVEPVQLSRRSDRAGPGSWRAHRGRGSAPAAR